MRKRENHYFKGLFMALMVSTLLVSCGAENESGKSRNNNPFGGYSYAGITSANGMRLPSNWLEIVGNQNPCQSAGGYYGSTYNNNQRRRVVIPLQGYNVNAGAAYVGVTPEGDIGIVSNQKNGPVIEMYLCPRPDLSGQGQVIKQPALNTSSSCPVSEITAMDVSLTSTSGYGNYLMKFAPIHIPNAGRVSQLCQQGGYYY